VLFQTNRNGTADIYSRRADGGADAQEVLAGTANYTSARYSPDGSWMIYVQDDELYARRTETEAESQALGITPWSGDPGSISPNGRWLAYAASTSDDPGDVDVYVVPFPNTTSAIRRISSEGGFSPIWSHTGRELFYKTVDHELVSVDVLDSSNFSEGERRVLFTLGDAYIWDAPGVYDITSNDERFVMIGMRTGGLGSELIVVENFFEELEERVGN
jgi:Tol biopolymer transport system component